MRGVARVAFSFILVVAALLAPWSARLALAADDGAKVFAETCTGCHTPEKMTQMLKGRHPTQAEWNETIKRMIGLGAEVPKKRVPVLLDYLQQAYGPADAPAAPAH